METRDALVAKLVEIDILDKKNFLKIKETLTRIGIPSKKDNTLYQTCHILHKKGKFYVIHFKELFALDGKISTFDDKDLARRNTIAHLLNDWGLCKIVSPEKAEPVEQTNTLKIISFKDKGNWNLVPKYNIGKK